ncbi:hypothetical protein [Pseudomonas indica]|uniref:hypothetical protein n=1 Tax=Pseudomonas indica TaxID=137658 RepID=UPI003FD1D1A8
MNRHLIDVNRQRAVGKPTTAMISQGNAGSAGQRQQLAGGGGERCAGGAPTGGGARLETTDDGTAPECSGAAANACDCRPIVMEKLPE